MIQKIGVKCKTSDPLNLTKELLFFDRIHCFEFSMPDVYLQIKNVVDTQPNSFNNPTLILFLIHKFYKEYQVLEELGIVIPHSQAMKNAQQKVDELKKLNLEFVKRELENSTELLKMLNDFFSNEKEFNEKNYPHFDQNDMKDFLKNNSNNKNIDLLKEIPEELNTRIYTALMNTAEDDSCRYIPILKNLPQLKLAAFQDRNLSEGKMNAMSAIFKSLPMPGYATPIQEVIDFRKDSEAKGHILSLNNWIIDASTKNLSKTEIEQKIEYLIFEYGKFIKLHKLKFEMSTFEIIVTTAAEMAENLVRLKFSKIAEKIFEFSKSNLKLMEAELNAPGMEMAYISEAKNKFN
jgi:hypothetical protein